VGPGAWTRPGKSLEIDRGEIDVQYELSHSLIPYLRLDGWLPQAFLPLDDYQRPGNG
jgi:hypothetical protein